MLELARREAERHQVADRCEFVQADFLELNLEDKFDISIAMGVFDYVPDQVMFLRKMVELTSEKEIIRIPSSGGVYVLVGRCTTDA
jgi:ubiquinone/menaquinone biosynthesis C-methylase UbiE